MPGVITRLNRLRKLYDIKHGPGAAILPAQINRIHMEFAVRYNDGHMGPRKFWRENLKRLKFWNARIPMIVNRTTDQQGPATLTLYFRESSSEAAPSPAGSQLSSASDGRSKAPPPLENERVATIDMKHKHSSAILEEFLKKTGAVPVMPTPQDEAELREIKELEERANYDRARVKKKVDAAKKEAQLLAQARNEVAAMKTAA